MNSPTLSFRDHNQPFFGMEMVYPVVSRRTAGVSIGIDLNPNHACNWACNYCQVTDLKRGKAPPVDLERLTDELGRLLDAVMQTSFMETYVPEGLRVLRDVAFSGNGEPTSSTFYPAAMTRVLQALEQRPSLASVKIITITNGTHGLKPSVRAALRESTRHHGEVWFKIDRGDREDIWRVNRVRVNTDQVLARLKGVSTCCPTWIQTCMTAQDGQPPAAQEIQRYLDFMVRIHASAIPVQGVLLYTLARPSHQPGGDHLDSLSSAWLETLAATLRLATGWIVRVF